MSKRKELCLNNLNLKGKGLEIGPSISPICPKKEGYNIDIMDHLDREGLIGKYRKNPNLGDEEKIIEEVDFVWSGQPYADLIGKTEYYDYIIASHVIEHCVDLIDFLRDCSSILKPEGVISLMIPDKRYTYDYFREVSSIRTVVDNYTYRKHLCHSVGAFLDSVLNSVRLDFGGVYVPNGAYLLENHMIYEKNMEVIKEKMETHDETKHIDFHSWIFTPSSFALIIYQLNCIGLIDLQVEEISKAPKGVEFFVKLKKGKITYDNKELLGLQIKKQKEIVEMSSYENTILEWSKTKKIYIYGTGKQAESILAIVKALNADVEGFIVSDDQQIAAGTFFDLPVFHLKEIVPYKKESGIVISVRTEVYEIIENNLIKNGFENYI